LEQLNLEDIHNQINGWEAKITQINAQINHNEQTKKVFKGASGSDHRRELSAMNSALREDRKEAEKAIKQLEREHRRLTKC
jgi:predicted  nucleic acid-binding Zn-ribbon protein